MPKHKPANLGIDGKKAVLEFYKSFRGERQTAPFASAIVQETELLLNKPTSHLDLGNQIKMLRTIKILAEEKGISIIMTTHAPEHAFLAGNKPRR